ncbi:hypothetical protein [Paenibacillus sp. 1P07SE]|uniref:hypothetical protein n=1 Tax=Paenibacillus sp. 1P07SE TaxID=3132209 RepID=UPI0039A4A8AC
MISYGYVGESGSFTEQAITVCLSGSDGLKDAYFAFISETTGKLSAFKDQVHSVTGSRHAQVSDYFPREADIYHRFYAIHWKHIESGFDLLMPGNWSQEEEQRLEAMMRDATQKGYTLRFYSLNGAVGAWLHAGTVDGQNGERPDVAMQDGRIVAVYRSSSKLQYTAGTWGTGGALSWQFTGQMQGQDGTDPTVAFVGEDKIIEMHTSQNTGLIWYNIGELHWPSVNWVHNHIWDSGVSSKPSVDYHAGHHILIDVHKAGLNDALWYNSGRVHFP